jgi:hypothetical protein
MRKSSIIAIGLMFLISSAFAGGINKLAMNETEVVDDGMIVPISLENVATMAGMELPLEYSDGVVLDEVTFENTRSENFDLRVANIDAENNMVIIALVPVVYGEGERLQAGSGVVANLHFSVTDPDLEEMEISVADEMPNHKLMFVETQNSELVVTTPEFETMTVALATSSSGPNVPTSFALHQNFPNPFNPSTTLNYDLDAASHVKLEVFNVLGQQVSTLVDQYQDAGYYSVQWDGMDDSGAPVATGVYFYRVNAGDNKVETKKMMLLK